MNNQMKKNILNNTQLIFDKALTEANFSVALRALELQAKIYGLMGAKKSLTSPIKPLKEMNEEELKFLIESAQEIT